MYLNVYDVCIMCEYNPPGGGGNDDETRETNIGPQKNEDVHTPMQHQPCSQWSQWHSQNQEKLNNVKESDDDTRGGCERH